MTKNTTIAGVVALALGLTLAVIGRYAGYGAELLRPEVVLGFGVVATLIALIALEYRTVSTRVAAQQIACDAGNETVRPASKVVPLVRNDQRIAA
jgi:hypothetical protein